jgi:hypothetical protein
MENFKYQKILERGLINFRPWKFLSLEKSSDYSLDLSLRYPKRKLIPFAIRTDCDDVACWDLSKNNDKIYIIHDFASEGWEEQQVFENFDECFLLIINDMFSFED